MADMTLTEEQLELRELAREFAEKELRPIVAEGDRKAQSDPAGCFPMEALKAASRLGLRTLGLPKEYGGRNISVLTHCILMEEVASIDPGFAGTFHQIWRLLQPIAEYGTEEQKKKFIVPFAEDETCLVSVGQTEPEAGTDNTLPYGEPDGGLRLSAVKQGDEWVLNGTKHFIACAAIAKLFIIFGRTDRNAPVSKGVTQFLMWRDTPGFKIARTHDKLGLATLMNAELVFENVRIPESDVFLGENLGYSPEGTHHGRSTPEISSLALGVARGAYEKALAYAREAVQEGKPLIQHDAIAMRLANMLTLIEATRSMIWKAAYCADHPETFNNQNARIGSYMSTVCMREVCGSAMQIFGRDGYMRSQAVEKMFRDGMAIYHINSTVEGRLLKIGNTIAASGQKVYDV